jgi:3-oxoacyl-[acyl-carrier protein] reductase
MLAGRVGIITGAGRGIGRATALLLAREGASLVVNDYDAGPAEDTVKAISDAGGKAVAFPGDVTAKDFGEKFVQKAVETFGDLHIIVNNAGYTWDCIFHRMTDEQWYAMLDVHLTASYRFLRAAAGVMRERSKAEANESRTVTRKVISVMSTSGQHGNPGQANYAAAKAGLEGLTKTLAKEWGPMAICCNAVSFGFIATRLNDEKEKGETAFGKVPLGIPKDMRDQIPFFIPLRRPGTVDEAAGPILFLASPLSDYVTGHVLTVDGGLGM